MLPCFFRGMVSTLVASIRSARITIGRVSWGSITSSMNPCSAAMNGLAKRSRNSCVFSRARSVLRQGPAIEILTAPFGSHHGDLGRGPGQVHVARRVLEPITQ